MSAYAVVLLAYAQVAATLTGFIEVVFVFAERARRLDGDLSSALFHLMFASLGAPFLSLFAALLLVYSVAEEHIAWQICNALSGFIYLLGAGRLTCWRPFGDLEAEINKERKAIVVTPRSAY
jgi:hypothetical protein